MLSLETLSKIVACYELPAITTPDDEVFGSIRLLIEVVKAADGSYGVRVFRIERVNAEPAYGERATLPLEKITCEIRVADDSMDWDQIRADSEPAAIAATLKMLNAQFGMS